MEYMVDIEQFHGPLDLLLYLLEHNEVNLYDIPIAVITEQFVQYMALNDELDLEKRNSFLLMASYLLKLKSVMLLPRSYNYGKDEGELEEVGEQDLRRELVRKLLEYKKIKQAGIWLETMAEGQSSRVFYRVGVAKMTAEPELSVSLNELIRAYKQVADALPPIQETGEYWWTENEINIEEKMTLIADMLNTEYILFKDLFSGIFSRRQVLACFLALLELVRLQRVEAYQNDSCGAIKIRLRAE